MSLRFQARELKLPNVSSTTRSTGRRLNFCGVPDEDRAPQTECIEECSSEKDSLHCSQPIFVAYG